ncbi:MAG TPA: 6-pyruvoyl-tetrahydropterin synthase-related protein [Patescibacteria group bacterium]|nr:6-pyruvoyl-tetrahydropterin synthase-related protein [Patescibacteria group bacterium]
MKRLLPVLIILLVSVLSIVPLFAPGYFPMHDDTQVARVIEMGRALSEGQFPVRWVADLGFGYGYPIFNFYGPLPYYVGGVLYAMGVPALMATKLMMGIGVILPAIALYLVMTTYIGWHAAFVSSLLYLYAPYHAVQIYVRGSVGEYWTLIFWPIILYGVARPHVLIGSIGLAGAIVSHTLLGYVTVLGSGIGLGIYWVYRILRHTFDRPVFVNQVAILLLGLGLSAFYWLPALLEMEYTSVAGQVSVSANYADHFVCPSQLWSSLWGFGGSAPGCIDGMSFMLGKLHILLAVAGVVVWFMRRRKTVGFVFIAGTILTFVGTFFSMRFSQIIWDALPGFSYLQYPWRFLSVTGLGLSILGGGALLYIRNHAYRSVALVTVTVFILMMNLKWFVPQYMYVKQNQEFESERDIRWRVSRISDEYLPSDLSRPTEESQAVFDTISKDAAKSIVKLEESAVVSRYVVEATRASEIVIYNAYFPGWRYRVNNQEVTPRVEGGLPVLPIGIGQSVVELVFTDTPVRTAGNMVSLVSVLMVGLLIYDKQRKAKR